MSELDGFRLHTSLQKFLVPVVGCKGRQNAKIRRVAIEGLAKFAEQKAKGKTTPAHSRRENRLFEGSTVDEWSLPKVSELPPG